MQRTTLVLVVLLLLSNAAWWLVGSRAPAEPPLVEGADHVPAATPTAPEAARVQGLEEELRLARMRIAALEAATSRTPAEDTAPAKPPKRPARPSPELAERARRAHELAKQWTEAALQTVDPRARLQALESIRQALRNGDPAEMLAALRSLAQLRELEYDKESFRELAAPCLQSADEQLRAAALYAVYNTAPRPEDLPVLLRMVDDPSSEVRSRLAHVVSMYRKGKVDGDAADAVLRLLDDADPQVRHETLSSLWGANVDERIETHYLTLAADPRQRHDAIYFGLSTFDPKSPRVVDALLAALGDANPETAGRAAWGLSTGVPIVSQAAVADAFLRQLETRSSAERQDEALRILQRYGSARHVPSLEVFAARPGLSSTSRQRIEQLIAQLRTR